MPRETSLPTYEPKTQIVWPWPEYKKERLRLELLKTIETALNARRIRTRRRKPGLRMEIGGRVLRVWLMVLLRPTLVAAGVRLRQRSIRLEDTISRFVELT